MHIFQQDIKRVPLKVVLFHGGLLFSPSEQRAMQILTSSKPLSYPLSN